MLSPEQNSDFSNDRRNGGTTLMKVVAYVTRLRGSQHELLVFEHRDHPEAGLQVPAGTIDPGEPPEAAAARELAEETGVHAKASSRIDVYEWQNPTTGHWHRRHVYHFDAPANLPDRWEHVVTAGEEDRGLVFICHWLEIDQAAERLCSDQGHSLRRLGQIAPTGRTEP
jgi:8-oxo-dGTP diphosphatase